MLMKVGEGHCDGSEVAGEDTKKHLGETGGVLKLDRGHCEGTGVVEDSMEQQ